ncbi:protein S100-A16 isoform X1 [Myotis lucifugus]|uniref:protein S100-A16 isoform X1 n=2 Tax=Myotis lucifugus TaxID=59463 RepID=UPI000CCC04EB|nr:protein S100-A16 isoform X1 [Myotis lucifugus]
MPRPFLHQDLMGRVAAAPSWAWGREWRLIARVHFWGHWAWAASQTRSTCPFIPCYSESCIRWECPSRSEAVMADCYTELEKAVVVLVENFYKYVSKPSPAKNKISKDSFQKMLQQELNHMLTNTGNRKAADKVIQDLDANQDGCVSFDEYWTLIGGIASPIANLMCEQKQQSSS